MTTIERSSRPGHSLSTGDISIQLLIDTTTALQEIQSRVTARAFAAVMDPTQGPAVREGSLFSQADGRRTRPAGHLGR